MSVEYCGGTIELCLSNRHNEGPDKDFLYDAFCSHLKTQPGIREIVINCTDLDYINSSDIGFFVHCLKESISNNIRLVITNLNNPLHEIFIRSKLDEHFIILPH